MYPDNYVSAPGTVYVKVTTPLGCTGTAKINLTFYPETIVRDDTIQSCFIENNILNGVFNLTTANVTSLTTGIIKNIIQPLLMLLTTPTKLPILISIPQQVQLCMLR